MPNRSQKRKYFQPKQGQDKRPKREELVPGMSGFLISCSQGNEVRCVREAYDILNEYMDIEMSKPEDGSGGRNSEDLKPVATAETPLSTKTEPEAPEDDAEKALAAEMAEFRTGAGIEERKARFKAIDSGCSNLVFISSAVTDPCRFAFDILSDIHKSGKGRARYMQRLFPVVATCRADLESVKKTASTALTKYFTPPESKSYLILYKARNSASALGRDSIIEVVGGVIKAINPECTANLSDPDYAVSVDIIKTMCCISVFRDFSKLKKYNIHVEEVQAPGHSRVKEETKGKNGDTRSEILDRLNEVESTKAESDKSQAVAEAEQPNGKPNHTVPAASFFATTEVLSTTTVEAI
ncbi:hypothetical protein RvY_09638 [Ramazzottius varieornatus]|uniref:THUMP domain-containing protein n=1 Tax=Ramazzottius varieornatus TaxID=947166 RepID=A0A1D1VC71_RAMVA|nr:hypothetical protein RvY_09638 [Ramazzottius varieornatus]